MARIYDGQIPLLRTTLPTRKLVQNVLHGSLVWCCRAGCSGMAWGYFGDVLSTASEARAAVVAVSRSIRIRYDCQGNKGIMHGGFC